MLRMKEHRANINRIVKDDRLSPNRRTLLQLIVMYFDADEKPRTTGAAITDLPFDEEKAAKDKDLLYRVLLCEYGNSRNIRWLDPADAPEDPTSRIELDATATIRSAFDAVLNPQKEDA